MRANGRRFAAFVVLAGVLLGILPATASAQRDAIFTGSVSGRSHLYRVNLETLAVTPFTSSTGEEMEATVSPDGTLVVFVSTLDGDRALYVAPNGPPFAPWRRLTGAVGSYAHPTFAPDGKSVTAAYSPDPLRPMLNTKLVSVPIEGKPQVVLVDSVIPFPRPSQDPGVTVVDHPAWMGPGHLVFAAVEYSDLDMPRVISSAIWRADLLQGKPTYLLGGPSSFDEVGRPHGFKATMPHREGQEMAFVGIQGSVDRLPMIASAAGKKARVIPLDDPDFVGPCLAVGDRYLYVSAGQDNWFLVLKKPGDKKPTIVPFKGRASEPVLIPAAPSVPAPRKTAAGR